MLVMINCDTCEHYTEVCYPIVFHDDRGSFPERCGHCKQHLKEVKPYDSCELWQSRNVEYVSQSVTSFIDEWEEKQ